MIKKTSSNSVSDQFSDSTQALEKQLSELASSFSALVEHPAIANLADNEEVKQQIRDRITEASTALTQARDSAAKAVHAKADAVDEYVRDEPWQVAGIAAAIGLTVGVLISRKYN